MADYMIWKRWKQVYKVTVNINSALKSHLLGLFFINIKMVYPMTFPSELILMQDSYLSDKNLA